MVPMEAAGIIALIEYYILLASRKFNFDREKAAFLSRSGDIAIGNRVQIQWIQRKYNEYKSS